MRPAPRRRPARSYARSWAVCAACTGILVVSGCVPTNPSPSPSGYEDKVKLSLEAALSEVATVQTTLEQLAADRAFKPAVLTQLRDSEKGVDGATRSFTELEPPPAEDRLHGRTGSLLSEAGDALESTRIAVARGERRKYPALVAHLKELSARLDALDKQVGS